MKIFFYVILFFVALFVFISVRLRNPYSQLTILFGKPGSGKSCKFAHDMLRDLKHGWIVYTDMVECVIPGVRIIDAHDLDSFQPEPNSAIYLDEIGLTFDSRKFKSFSDGLSEFFKLHRHYKCKVVVASQALDCDKKIRNLASDLMLQQNIGNIISISRPIKRTITLTDPSGDSESRVADKLEFSPFWTWKIYFMPRFWRYYDSYAVPSRPMLSFRELTGDLKQFDKQHSNDFLKSLRRSSRN